MALPHSFTILILLLLLIAAAAAATGDFEFGLKPKKKTHLHFYMHDIVSGPNATAIIVVPNPTNASLYTFGVVTAIDDPLTEGPNLTASKLIGRAQGLYTDASQKGFNLLWTVNLVFVEGKYKGSTLAVLGVDDALAAVRELPIVGGTGRFRLARGYVLMKTHAIDSVATILELDVYVMH